MAKFRVILERVETIIEQGAVMVEASTAEEPVETGTGDITVAVAIQANRQI